MRKHIGDYPENRKDFQKMIHPVKGKFTKSYGTQRNRTLSSLSLTYKCKGGKVSLENS